MRAPDLVQKFKQIQLTKSEHFTEIMGKYDAFGKHLSDRAFHMQYVKTLDPGISYRQWSYFMNKLNDFQKQYVAKALEESNRKALSVAKLEQNSIENIMKIGDISLQAVADNPELIHSIPLNTRVRWMFSAMKIRDTKLKTNLMQRQEEREQSMFEKMMEGAQYGGYEMDQIPVVEAEVIENAPETQIENAEERQVSHQL